jgi:hypothetical protein
VYKGWICNKFILKNFFISFDVHTHAAEPTTISPRVKVPKQVKKGKHRSVGQGCQIFLGPNIPKQETYICLMTTNYTKRPYIIPNGRKIYVPTFSILRPSKIYPDWYFWFENTPSGNPGQNLNHFKNDFEQLECRTFRISTAQSSDQFRSNPSFKVYQLSYVQVNLDLFNWCTKTNIALQTY